MVAGRRGGNTGWAAAAGAAVFPGAAGVAGLAGDDGVVGDWASNDGIAASNKAERIECFMEG
jgi:hypothetical protein